MKPHQQPKIKNTQGRGDDENPLSYTHKERYFIKILLLIKKMENVYFYF